MPELRGHVKEVVIPGRLAAVEGGYVSGQNGSCSEDLVMLWGIILWHGTCLVVRLRPG